MFQVMPTTRVRRSAFFERTVAAGVAGFATYNQMLLPSGYGDPEGEYWRLVNGVTLWDVAAQRQVELRGADAARLAQALTPRDLSSSADGVGKYAALCNHAGTVINDPIVLRLAPDRFWLSIADSNILFWARAIAAERAMDVAVHEPDVSPLAVQGPKAEDVIAALFGDDARAIKYFHFRRADLDGIPLYLARSGWSKQGGFELYLLDAAQGGALWDRVMEAGARWDIAAGCPNPSERIESGLLSWGGDTDDATNPFEVRLSKYVDLDVGDDVIGIAALRAIAKRGAARHQLGVILDDPTPMPSPHSIWYDIESGDTKVGDMTCGVWSYRLQRNIGFALVARECEAGDEVVVRKDGRTVEAQLVKLPFV